MTYVFDSLTISSLNTGFPKYELIPSTVKKPVSQLSIILFLT